jgi:hypothetical protein
MGVKSPLQMKRLCFYLCLIVGEGGGFSKHMDGPRMKAIPNSGLTPKHVRLKCIMNLDICKMVRLKRGRVSHTYSLRVG